MDPFFVAPDVEKAVADGRAVVALETTLVTHGLPRPLGLETALDLEDVVRAHGAVPATIGVLDGRIRVGLSRAELRRLAERNDVAKLNLSNLSAGVASGSPGSLTVAASLFAARRASIRVFATGGIGGVHREVAETGDVSADLGALTREPVVVVCAGAKAILDLRKTREALETAGVPVFGWSTDEFPAFYSRRSGLPVDARFDDLSALAAAIHAHAALGLGTGILVGNPIEPQHELPAEEYGRAIDDALARARARGVEGRNLTPFLLAELREATDGRSVEANRALLRSNARLAGRLAVALM